MGLRDKIYDSIFEKDDEASETPEVKKPEPIKTKQPPPHNKPTDGKQNTEKEKPIEKKPQNAPVSHKSSWLSIKEYERTCLQCGTVWHSLKSRETDLKLSAFQGTLGSCQGSLQQCNTCGMCGGTRQATSQRNWDANRSELDRLKSCPRCGSHSFSEKILTYDPKDPASEFNRGVSQARQGKHKEAIASYDRAIALKPDYFEAWYNRGVAQGKLGLHAEAIASCDKSVAINPEYAMAWFNRGVSQAKLLRNTEALASYDKSVAINPEYAMAWNNRGVLLVELGRYAEAIASYDRAIAINPDFIMAIKNREIALRKK